ncbi:hypothetical protein MPTK1_1g29360 [Marchantia polymorpha subsp. ruderalis]|uniref:Uncharacterized protein n=2 Tax=Marchantia polymorpha TaxID=3197 RepID=A0AAF6AVI4_MARPO|nr:hypothetical protein MARPO_0107s0051 [Marchantia polymorpha]BBN00455.1 hypothetical protein Mp_1g29360 [Marchantia polymorpha subsp. ruderalis]|eukprot:PTQ31784.1 hypothetical protein MARPO_0107s0051 [Marchantia polymorpha]
MHDRHGQPKWIEPFTDEKESSTRSRIFSIFKQTRRETGAWIISSSASLDDLSIVSFESKLMEKHWRVGCVGRCNILFRGLRRSPVSWCQSVGGEWRGVPRGTEEA